MSSGNVALFYRMIESDRTLEDEMDAAVGKRTTIQEMLEETVHFATMNGYLFTLEELRSYLIEKEDISVS